MESFLVIEFEIDPVEPGRDILLAVLDIEGYDSFEETDTGLKAYILEQDFDEEVLQALDVMQSPDFKITYQKDRLENKNWNEEWETNYSPIDIDGKVYIRAPFHEPKEGYPYEIVIMPKMSFGTGHHQTTRLMSRLLLSMDVEGKRVLDMGTGTGILAILASYRGAGQVTAIDNFEWAIENTAENVERNNCENVEALLGDAESLHNLEFDVVLANINRNVLLEDMKKYIETLNGGAKDLLPLHPMMAISGFFEEDFELLHNEASANGMELVKKINEDRWVACLYKKS